MRRKFAAWLERQLEYCMLLFEAVMNPSGETVGSWFSFAHPGSPPMTRFSRPAKSTTRSD